MIMCFKHETCFSLIKWPNSDFNLWILNFRGPSVCQSANLEAKMASLPSLSANIDIERVVKLVVVEEELPNTNAMSYKNYFIWEYQNATDIKAYHQT